MVFVEFFSALVVFFGVVIGERITDQIDNFMKAVQRRDFPEIERLVETVDMDCIHPRYSFQFLHIAVHVGDAEITKLLISKGWNKMVRSAKPYVYTPLYVLCTKEYQNKNGAYEIMEALLKAGTNADFGDFDNITGMAPLHIIQNESMARLLMSYGADVDAEDTLKRTPAHLSLLHNNCGVLKALADGGANFSVTDCYGNNIFHTYRPDYGFPITREIAMLLVQKGAPLEAFNQWGETPMTKFLKLYARLDRVWRRDWRPNPSRSDCDKSEYMSNLSYENLNDSFYACMLAAGADINRPNRMGQRLIHVAVREFEVDLVKWLLENGADVDCKNGNGDTPLLVLLKFRESNYSKADASRLALPVVKHVAFIKAVMKVIVNGGADVKTTDKEGYDAMHYLEKSNLASLDNEIAHLLLKE